MASVQPWLAVNSGEPWHRRIVANLKPNVPMLN
jgi:hypothetical protein